MVIPMTRTIEETREVTSSDSVSPTYLQVVTHGVAQHIIRCLKRYIAREVYTAIQTDLNPQNTP